MDVADIAANIAFKKSGMISTFGEALRHAFVAEKVTLALPRDYATTASTIKKMLSERKSSRALEDIDAAIRNFRKRTFTNLLPAAPLMLAVDRWCLQRDAHHDRYQADIPGYRERFLAICLLWNPNLWIESVLWFAEVWRQMLSPHFAPNTFPLLVPEQASSTPNACVF